MGGVVVVAWGAAEVTGATRGGMTKVDEAHDEEAMNLGWRSDHQLLFHGQSDHRGP
jgi:hypothetical protein